MSKSATAFRTISEVADLLDVPKHVLRFWEVKFPQIKPMKRGGGRRYYRPEDLELLRGIQHLLHAEGYTIKGVQKILREQGVDHVKAAAPEAAAPEIAPQAEPAAAGKAARKPARGARGKASAAARAAEPSVLARAIGELEEIRALLKSVVAPSSGNRAAAPAKARRKTTARAS